MEFVARADDRPERISIARCRELLGKEADAMTDDDVDLVRRHAETMAGLVVELYKKIGQIGGSCHAAETRLVGTRE